VNWRWVAFTALIAALMVSYGVLTGNHRDAAPANEGTQQLGYYMKDAVITETSVEGNPRLKLTSHTIQQNIEDNSVALFDVQVDYLSIPDKHWVLTADRGLVPVDSHTITFLGDVTLRQLDAQPGAIIRTPSVTVDSDANIARSSDPVSIELGNHSVLARGFTADLKTERVQLESQVHGRFQRQ
jgi:LPS export ABC transporter protein LptC